MANLRFEINYMQIIRPSGSANENFIRLHETFSFCCSDVSLFEQNNALCGCVKFRKFDSCHDMLSNLFFPTFFCNTVIKRFDTKKLRTFNNYSLKSKVEGKGDQMNAINVLTKDLSKQGLEISVQCLI